MLGQTNLLACLHNMAESGEFPRFSLVVGLPGSGKKTLCTTIAKLLGAQRCDIGTGVEDIRNMISLANRVDLPMLYVIGDADKMSVAAENALLKVTEEPPKNAYFVLTVSNINNLLNTIRSRGFTFYMEPYSAKELLAIADECKAVLTDTEQSILRSACATPGDVKTLLSYGVTDFYNYVIKVFNNIDKVSTCNVFKIGQQLRFKESDTDKYSLELFWSLFSYICIEHFDPIHWADTAKYVAGVTLTNSAISALRITGVNRQALFDMWLLDIRESWHV